MAFKLTSNLPEVAKLIGKQLKALQGDRVVRVALLSLTTVIYDRVHIHGIDGNNSKIGSGGWAGSTYNYDYWKFERAHWKRLEPQTKKVMQLTGKTSDSFTVGAIGGAWALTYVELSNGMQIPISDTPRPDGWGIGWANSEAGAIAAKQIDMHGDIYGATDEEEAMVVQLVNDAVADILANFK